MTGVMAAPAEPGSPSAARPELSSLFINTHPPGNCRFTSLAGAYPLPAMVFPPNHVA